MTVIERTVHDLVIQKVIPEADGVVSLHLADPEGRLLPAWEPGAHLDVVLASGLVRQYSLCGDPADRTTYVIAVLREPAGRGGSAEIHATLRCGVDIRVVAPRNHFELSPASAHLFIAGGIGITPLLPMMEMVSGSGTDWRLLYGGRSRASMAFLERVERWGGRVEVRPQDTCGLLPVEEAIRAMPGALVYCCGPEPLLDAVRGACDRLGRLSDLHFERFGAPPPSEAPAEADGRRPFDVRLARTGVTLTVPADRTLLDVVRDAAPDKMSDCEEGFCGSCETRVLEGVPEHHDTILSEAEQQSGETMMICVGRSRSPLLVLDL